MINIFQKNKNRSNFLDIKLFILNNKIFIIFMKYCNNIKNLFFK